MPTLNADYAHWADTWRRNCLDTAYFNVRTGAIRWDLRDNGYGSKDGALRMMADVVSWPDDDCVTVPRFRDEAEAEAWLRAQGFHPVWR